LKNGVQEFLKPLEKLDSGLRRNDGKGPFPTFYEFIKVSEGNARLLLLGKPSKHGKGRSQRKSEKTRAIISNGG
jgi:hypothetical protein